MDDLPNDRNLGDAERVPAPDVLARPGEIGTERQGAPEAFAAGSSQRTSQAMVTIVAPLDGARLAAAEAAIDAMGNPAEPTVSEALGRTDADGAGTHFASLHALASRDGARYYLLLELSGDGDADAALARLVGSVEPQLRSVFALAKDWGDGDMLAYLKRRRVSVGGGWFDNPGLCFAGTPGLSVGRIRFEAGLAGRITGILAEQTGELSALARVTSVRGELRRDVAYAAALSPADAGDRAPDPSTVALVLQLALSFVRTYLLPVAVVVVAWAVYSALRAYPSGEGAWTSVRAMLAGGLGGLWTAGWMAALLVVLALGVSYLIFRRAEAQDPLDDRMAENRTNAAMFERENHGAQNHMISVTERKPGLIRKFTSRLMFWVIGELGVRQFRPGHLGNIGSIHFARWVTPPGSPDLIFLSNYDGSWESYLEDFITKAHLGLTGVWSNTIFFPRSENLVQKGATDGERFKRFARRSMIPTRFWYTAYPKLTTRTIRTNAEIRRGLSGAMTEDEATGWLSLFGSADRPASKLVSSEIQSLMFGGLGFMQYGVCLLFDLPAADRAAARAWLDKVAPFVAFNDGRRLRHPAVVTLAFGSRGLARLGLPDSAIETFPYAFNAGMVGPARSRMLGDTGQNDPEHWRWGKSQPDVMLLIYGATPEDVAKLLSEMRDLATDRGATAMHEIPLVPVSRGKVEPFGFTDGVSQPVIRGTYKGLRDGDPIHLVEPGEFILGYPDDRGNVAPGPVLPALADPDNLLPLVGAAAGFDRAEVENPRDLGFNGSFMVVRELEQDVAGFADYCRVQSEKLIELRRLTEPYPLVAPQTDADKELAAEFIGAKMIGRWKDGSSLVRYPYEPKSTMDARKAEARRAADAEAASAASPNRTAGASPAPVDAPGVSTIVRNAGQTRGGQTPVGGPTSASVRNSDHGDNDFLFGSEDPEALRCPFGAHIRRANPRDSFDPGSEKEIRIVNRHRILRVGRGYEPAPGANPGLLFMCLNSDIERQFELVQQDWLRSPSFHGLASERDPLVGDGEDGVCGFTIPTRDGPVVLDAMPPFVTMRGGGYFFLPGKRLVEYLARPE